MVNISYFEPGYTNTPFNTAYHHTDQTQFDSTTIAGFKIDRFFIELSHGPVNTNQGLPTLLSTGTLTFNDGGTVETNANVDGASYNDVSSGHLEPLTGTQFNVGDFYATTDTGTVWDFSVYPRFIGLRFDVGNPATDGVPIMGYVVEMQNSGGGAVTYFLPNSDQDLSQLNLPYPSGMTEPGGYTYSTVSTYVEVPDQDSDASGTYVAYGDLYNGLPPQFTGAVCFTKGTLIHTIDGQRPIEELKLGDLVWTSDQGYQPIRWIGASTLFSRDLQARETLRPVRIPAGSMGPYTPETDLIVSPQHRMYIRSNVAEKMYESAEVLIPAKDLVGNNGIHRIDDDAPVTYFHIMFDDHQIIMANGCLSESFYTGPEALRALSNATRQELYAIFPELITMTGICHTPARPFVKGKRARNMMDRHYASGQSALT